MEFIEVSAKTVDDAITNCLLYTSDAADEL